jgi:TolB-like protein/tetratricopeptide (TPR) repeat protein
MRSAPLERRSLAQPFRTYGISTDCAASVWQVRMVQLQFAIPPFRSEINVVDQTTARHAYLFGPFRLLTAQRILLDGSRPIRLGSRAMDILVVLLERAGELVSNRELRDAVWPDTVVVEQNLAVNMAALRRALGDGQSGNRYIVNNPGRGYRFVAPVTLDVGPQGSAVQLEAVVPSSILPMPDKPSIAVLAFQNMSGDPEQEYFADGVVEELITELSRFHGLFVIARNSSFAYKGRAVDVKQVGRELGVRYVLEGSVRKAGSRLRITGQLIDASSGVHLWADRFEGGLENIFDLQDQVTKSVLGAITPKMEQAEIERAKRKPTDSLDAYDYFLQGMASVYKWTREAHNEALRLFYRAIELDPGFASAHGIAAMCYTHRKANDWMIDRVHEIGETARLTRRAVELGRDDAFALTSAGQALAYVLGDAEGAAALLDRALALNPNLAIAWYSSGSIRRWLGQHELAIEHLVRAMRLSPLDQFMHLMQSGVAHGHFFVGRYDEASVWAAKALRENPILLSAGRIAAASHALAGHLEPAQQALARMREIDPALRIHNLKDVLGPYRQEDLARLAEGLRKAGLAE